jgi:hypothetical protein
MRAVAKKARGPKPNAGEKGMMSAAPGPAQPIQKRQLEKSVSWTAGERLRCLCCRLRLTVREMNYATRRIVELRAPGLDGADGSADQPAGAGQAAADVRRIP